MKLSLMLVGLSVILMGCGAPAFRPESERFAPAPEIIEQLQPYLAEWATTPQEETRDQRRTVASEIEDVIAISVFGERTTTDRQTIYIVDIRLDSWADWYRGYYYVHDGSDLTENQHLQLVRVSDNLYIYNRTE